MAGQLGKFTPALPKADWDTEDQRHLPEPHRTHIILAESRESGKIRPRVHIGAKPSAPLAPGCYLYCGSAKGPGGLRARLAHHMRHGKSIHWHIDRLTEAGTVLGAWAFPGGDECDLVAALSHLPVAIEGFGSTDCRKCTSHLLRWPPGAGTLFRKDPVTPRA